MTGGHAHHHGGTDHGDTGHGDTVGLHGMLLFGQDVLYLSHLPMFERPHNFQVLLEVGFDDAARERLDSDRQGDSQGMYTFVPEVFPISELAPDASDPGAGRTEIAGTIVRGHFERGGTAIAENAIASIQRIVAFKELDTAAAPAPERELTYLCFGRGGELYLVHEITARPNFDQVLGARLVPDTGTDQAGRRLAEEVSGRGFEEAAPVRFRGRSDRPESRLSAPETLEGFFFRSIGPGGAHGFLVQLEVQSELYLQVDELA